MIIIWVIRCTMLLHPLGNSASFSSEDVTFKKVNNTYVVTSKTNPKETIVFPETQCVVEVRTTKERI